MSSSDLETPITQRIKKDKPKKKSKPKQPAVTTVQVGPDTQARNEGDDPHWAYEPPEGAVLLDHTVDVGAFEWDAIKDDEDTEIWLIQVPDTVKAKHLDGLEIDLPSSSRTARIGRLTRKTASYDVWSIGEDDDADDATDSVVVGGEELRGLTCLLPRKRKKGRLYRAPKQVSKHIVVTTRPPVAKPPGHEPLVYPSRRRASYPKDVLKHAFVPYGARSTQPRSEAKDVSMDVDNVEVIQTYKPSSDAAPPLKEKPPKIKESKGKKRKVEGDTPKKSKKHKLDSDP